MSLSREEWKKVLDQPKNLGMKAGGGTGIGKCLDAVDKALVGFETTLKLKPAEAAEHGAAAKKALDDLKRQCDEAIDKHKKLFTTACAYLANVKVSAEAKKTEVNQKLAHLEEWEHGCQEMKARTTAIQHLCGGTERELKAAEDLKELAELWAKFKQEFAAKVGQYEQARCARKGAFNEAVSRVQLLKPDGVKPDGFARMRSACAGLAGEIWMFAERVTPPRFV